MRSLLKRNFPVALICALPAVLGVESAIGHSGAGSSSAAGSSGGHGGGNFPSAPSAPSGGHSSTGLNSAHMSGALLGGHFTTNPLTNVTGQETQRPVGSSIQAQFEQALTRVPNSVNSAPGTCRAICRGTTNCGGNTIVTIVFIRWAAPKCRRAALLYPPDEKIPCIGCLVSALLRREPTCVIIR